MIVVKGESHKLSCYVYESVEIVDIIYKVSCCVLDGGVIVVKGESYIVSCCV